MGQHLQPCVLLSPVHVSMHCQPPLSICMVKDPGDEQVT
jgi:hypothetical protein